MQTVRDPLALLTDPAFRCAVAVVHAERLAGLDLRWAAGRRSWVSHDPSFSPSMSPCRLRLMLAQAAVGAEPGCLADITGWSVGGPFVEPLGRGVIAHGGTDSRTCWFATTIAPVGIQQLGAAIDLGTDGVDATRPTVPDPTVQVSMDPAVGVSCVRVSGPPTSPVDESAKLLALACRHRERVLRLARR